MGLDLDLARWCSVLVAAPCDAGGCCGGGGRDGAAVGVGGYGQGVVRIWARWVGGSRRQREVDLGWDGGAWAAVGGD